MIFTTFALIRKENKTTLTVCLLYLKSCYSLSGIFIAGKE